MEFAKTALELVTAIIALVSAALTLWMFRSTHTKDEATNRNQIESKSAVINPDYAFRIGAVMAFMMSAGANLLALTLQSLLPKIRPDVAWTPELQVAFAMMA